MGRCYMDKNDSDMQKAIANADQVLIFIQEKPKDAKIIS